MKFYLNVGRSGSMATAKAFGILHEPDGSEPNIRKMKTRIKENEEYGETSHFWKKRLKELINAFPDADYYHLVRNGRKVVGSFKDSSRHYLYDKRDEFPTYTYRNEPLPIKGFKEMSRFEKLCWYWRYWNETIEKEAGHKIKERIKLEDLNIPKANKGVEQKPWTKEQNDIFNVVN